METTSKLPAKLRNSGDKAKIISSNDTSGYTFRGRFKTAEEAACIGYVSSQKTFNALRWLVNKQGYRNGSEQIVCWKADGDEPIPILAGSSEIFGDADELVEFNNTDTAERYAAKVRKAIAGYRADISDSEGITVMAIDTADGSNQGRLSITYYQHMTGSDLINNIEKWHRDCSWEIRYVKDRVSGKYLDFIGAPSPVDIARAAYGTGREGLLEADDKVQKKCIDRILPCIVQGKNIPKDIVRAAVFNAGEPERFTSYNWMKIMEIACALIRKQTIETYGDKRGDELMSLDVESRDRSYLFGRLLAIMKRAEEYANYKSGEDRTTSAEKYWNVFSRKPAKTVAILQEKLMPYFARMNPGTRNYYSLQIEDVMNALEEVSGFNNEHLTEQYLIGYYNQYASMRKKADENNDNDSETQEDK
jgi:CRISPR-associated protein Csd1